MARIPQYVQGKLESARVGTPGLDTSGLQLAESALHSAGAAADALNATNQNAIGMERQALAYNLEGAQRYQNAMGALAANAFVGLRAWNSAATNQVQGYQQDIAVAKAQYLAKQFIRDRSEKIQGQFSNPEADPAGAVDAFKQDLEPALDAYAQQQGLKQKGMEKVYSEFYQTGLAKAAATEDELHSWSVSQGNQKAGADLISLVDQNSNTASRYGETGDWNRFNDMMNDFAATKQRFVNRFGAEGVKIWNKGREQAVTQYVSGRLGAAENMIGQSGDVVKDINQADAVVNSVKQAVNANNFPWLEATDIKLLQERADGILKAHATLKDKAIATNHQGWRNTQYMKMADAYASTDESFVRQTISNLQGTLANYAKDQNPDYYDQKAAQELVSEIGKLTTHANNLHALTQQDIAATKAEQKAQEEAVQKAEQARLNSPEAQDARINAEEMYKALPSAEDIQGTPSELATINRTLRALTNLRASGFDGPADKINRVLENKIAHIKELSAFTQGKAQENLTKMQKQANAQSNGIFTNLDFQVPARLQALEKMNAPAPNTIQIGDQQVAFAQQMTGGNKAAMQYLNDTFRDARAESIKTLSKAGIPQAIDFANADRMVAAKMWADPTLKAKLRELATQKAAPKPAAKPVAAKPSKDGLVPPPPPTVPSIVTTDPLMRRALEQDAGPLQKLLSSE